MQNIHMCKSIYIIIQIRIIIDYKKIVMIYYFLIVSVTFFGRLSSPILLKYLTRNGVPPMLNEKRRGTISLCIPYAIKKVEELPT